MKEDYFQHLLDMAKLCRELDNFVKEEFYKDGSVTEEGIGGRFCYFPRYRQLLEPIKRAVEISDLFGIQYFEKWKPVILTRTLHLETPSALLFESRFKTNLGQVKKAFRRAKNEIREAISNLNPEEIDRLNEAIHCFLEGCFYSSVAMSVSAIEFRLFSLMVSMCPDSKLEELTLGQLIREYLDNKQKYGSVIPKKHEPLLEHCNTYRIFSVHPKKEEINKPIASSILNMTFLFLLDKKLAKKAEGTEAS